MGKNWRHIGSAESVFTRVLSPCKELVENTETGEQRTVWVNSNQSVGDAISNGQWADKISEEDDSNTSRRERIRGSDDTLNNGRKTKEKKKRQRKEKNTYYSSGYSHSGDSSGAGCAIPIIGIFVLMVIGFFMSPSGHVNLKQKTTKTELITTSIGLDCACGNHAGSFDVIYKGMDITVYFHFNPNPANPIENPLRVFKANKEIRDWDSLLCPKPGQSKAPLSGKQVVVEGEFTDKSSFKAHKIHITP